MIEVWFQWTCNGCGATGNSETPSLTKAEFIADLKASGFKLKKSDLLYCRQCVRRRANKRNEDIFRSES